VILEEGIDSRSQAGRQSIQVLESFARLEFSYHSQRKKAGIRAARQDGRRIGRPPAAVPADFRSICQSWARGEISGRDAAGQSGLGSTSFYKKAQNWVSARHDAKNNPERHTLSQTPFMMKSA
jgi:DNA invertase Pin-like site-specific DNA recombinase